MHCFIANKQQVGAHCITSPTLQQAQLRRSFLVPGAVLVLCPRRLHHGKRRGCCSFDDDRDCSPAAAGVRLLFDAQCAAGERQIQVE